MTVYSTPGCPHCVRAKNALATLGVPFEAVDVSDATAREALADRAGATSVPQIYAGATHVGGADALEAAIADGTFDTLLESLGVERSFEAKEHRVDVRSLHSPGGPLNVLREDNIAEALQRRALELIDAHVTATGVDYDALRESPLMASFAREASALARLADVKSLDDAFWINLYNVLVMHGNVIAPPENSPESRQRFFGGGVSYRVGQFDLSLDDIEHGILRRSPKGDARGFDETLFDAFDIRNRPPFDNRIHFAINCGARSCPPVKIFKSATLDADLSAAAAAFCGSEIAMEDNVVTVSRLFMWYRTDFCLDETDDRGLVHSLASFLPDTAPLKDQLLSASAPRVEFAAYDWGRNDASS